MKKGLALTIQMLMVLLMLASPVLMLATSVSTVSADALYSRTITVNAEQVPSAQTDFPLLVSLSSTTLKDTGNGGHVANADGSDIYFTDESGAAQYSWEIESYDNVNGTLFAWVKVPSLSDGTVIKIWYGGSGGAANTPSDVWDSGFKGVWHMNQVDSLDSTVNDNDGTAQGTPAQAEGKIDGSLNFPGNTAPAYINCGNDATLHFNNGSAYTWEAWINLAHSQSGGMGVIGKKSPDADSTGQGYEINVGGGTTTLRFQSTSDSTYQMASSTLMTVGSWTHIAVTYDNASAAIYVNGVLNNSAIIPSTPDVTNDLFIGYRRSGSNAGQGYFWGMIDEVKYSTAVRSADWILTEYNNQNSPGAFYTVGSEESSGTPSEEAPSITTQPADQSVTEGETATFTAAASGAPEPTVQWQESIDGGSTWSDLSGETGTSLSLTSVKISQSGYKYQAIFTNNLGSATTNAATLTVSAAPPTPPSWPADSWLRAYNVGTADKPDVLLMWSQPTDGTNGGEVWGYTVLADYAAPPQMHIDSIGNGELDEYRDYTNRSYLWTTDNGHLHTGGDDGGYGGFIPWPEANKNYYFSMRAYDWSDSLSARSPVVHFSTAWNPMMYAESSGRYTYMNYPASTVSYVEASGTGGAQTVYNIVTNPVDPDNTWFRLYRTAGTNPNWQVLAGAVDPHFILTDKETGEVIPLTPNLIDTPAKYNSWPMSAGWTSDKGTFYGWKSGGPVYIECHVTYYGAATSTTQLQSNHTYVLSLIGPWAALYIPSNYTYSWEFTTAQADKEAPTWPGDAALTASPVTPTTVTLSWPEASDNVGVTAYDIYRNGSKIASVNGSTTSYLDTGRTPGTEYTYDVKPSDYLVNVGNPISVGTTTPVDSAAPTWPEGSTLEARNVVAAELDLVWTPAADEFPVTGYRIYKGDELIATVAGDVLTYHVIGLDPGQPYFFNVQAGDETDHWSTDGPSVSTGTGDDTLPPTWPDGSTPTVTGVTPTSISLSWPAAADNYKVDHYEVFVNGSLAVTVAATTTNATVSDLAPASGYDLYVVAVDPAPAGNRALGDLINQWVPSLSPSVGSSVPFYLITPSQNAAANDSEVDNVITCLIPAGDLYIRWLFLAELNEQSFIDGITLTDETLQTVVPAGNLSLTFTANGSPVTDTTVDLTTTGGSLLAGHTYAARLSSNIAAVNGTTLGKDYVWRFTTPDRPDRVVAISHNDADHEVILKSDGTVWSWGTNSNGQLGDGTTNDSAVAVQALGLDHVIAVTAASDYTLALRSDGTVWGMGRNNYGQLGIGPIDTTSGQNTNEANIHSTPSQVPGIDGIQAVVTSQHDSSALRYDGTVWSWGSNRGGGGGAGIGSSPAGEAVILTVPTLCPGLTQVTAIAKSRQNTYALRQDETVWAAGNNAWGQLGTSIILQPTGPSTNHFETAYFQQVPGLRRVVSISAERTHALAVDRDGYLWYWGNVGNPWPAGWIMTPIIVPDISNAVTVAAGMPCEVVLCSDGTVYIVHYLSEYSANGAGSYGPYSIEQAFAPSVLVNVSNAVFIEGGYFVGHAITADGGLYTFSTRLDTNNNDPLMPTGEATLESYPAAPPSLIPDTAGNFGCTPIQITFTDDATWRDAIFAVKVEGVALAEDKYAINEGEVAIAADVFPTVKDYDIVIEALGYIDAATVQTIDHVTLTYGAGNGGSIIGITSQTINCSENGTEVTAVPDEGYFFFKWSDGVSTASRTDTNVADDIAVNAIFSDRLGLKDGWTLVSTDKPLSAAATWDGVTLAYKYTPSGGFVEADIADIEPLSAIFVKTEGGGSLNLVYAEGADPGIYSKDLEAGWNLISTHSGAIAANDLLSQLRHATVGAQQGAALSTLVSREEYNRFTGDFYKATLTDANWDALTLTLDPFDGYWAYMNADKTFEVIP